jgi:hypothetical protein
MTEPITEWLSYPEGSRRSAVARITAFAALPGRPLQALRDQFEDTVLPADAH